MIETLVGDLVELLFSSFFTPTSTTCWILTCKAHYAIYKSRVLKGGKLLGACLKESDFSLYYWAYYAMDISPTISTYVGALTCYHRGDNFFEVIKPDLPIIESRKLCLEIFHETVRLDDLVAFRYLHNSSMRHMGVAAADSHRRMLPFVVEADAKEILFGGGYSSATGEDFFDMVLLMVHSGKLAMIRHSEIAANRLLADRILFARCAQAASLGGHPALLRWALDTCAIKFEKFDALILRECLALAIGEFQWETISILRAEGATLNGFSSHTLGEILRKCWSRDPFRIIRDKERSYQFDMILKWARSEGKVQFSPVHGLTVSMRAYIATVQTNDTK